MSTIMVVDDMALARESLAKLLEYEGFKTIRSANGKEAWATLYNEVPDLILLDLMMPQMDGITFLDLLRRSPLWRNIPVIVLTGAEDKRMINRARDLKIQELIPKATFGIDDLLNHVRKHIKGEGTMATASAVASEAPVAVAGPFGAVPGEASKLA